MRLARTLLLVPATAPDLVRASAHPADVVVIDLASTVAEHEKVRGRSALQAHLAQDHGQKLWIRVNGPATGLLAADLEAITGGSTEGIVLPQARTADEIRECDRMLGAIERSRGITAGSIGLIVQLDNARAVFFAHELAQASARVASLCFNGAQDGDLAVDLGCAWSSDGPELMYARQYALVAARACGIGCPLDGAFANVEDNAGLVRDTELSRRLGYRGRVVVALGQIEPVNRVYSPTLEEVEYHRRVLAAFAAAVAEGRASVALEGKMIDAAHEATARAVIAQAQALGVIP